MGTFQELPYRKRKVQARYFPIWKFLKNIFKRFFCHYLESKNGEILKAGLKILFKIKDRDDRFNRGVYINTFDFDSWYEKYSTKELIDLSKYLSKSDISLIKKLDIKIKNKIYTEQEFEVLNMDLLSYYI